MSNNRLIDLRKSTASAPAPQIISTFGPYEPKPTASTLEWKALEYEKTEHGPYWFMGTGAVATILIVVGILARSYFFIAFVAIAYIVMILYAKREPRELTFSITSEGVQTGRTFHGFSDIKSFWVFDKEEGEKYFSLEINKILSPFLQVPLDKVSPKEVKEMLNRFLPEKEHQESLIDQIIKSVGL